MTSHDRIDHILALIDAALGAEPAARSRTTAPAAHPDRPPAPRRPR